jgi:hypothetical protein
MYQAELKGKLPPSASDREDLLTSNVFSFLKYADRTAYLGEFLLRVAQLDIPPSQLRAVSFQFWPCLDDGTQPDVVIETETHYLLVEAKYHSGVAEENGNPAGQLVRECDAGAMVAANRSKSFRRLLITDDSTPPSSLLSHIPARHRAHAVWTNWQSVAALLLAHLEANGTAASNYLFARDLYDLLDYKHLRGFISFARLADIRAEPVSRHIFFAEETASFRGDFIGFAPALSILATVPAPPSTIFYATDSPFNLPRITRPLFTNHIFYPTPSHEQRT